MPHPWGAPPARRRLQAELARPVDPTAAQPRAVLLCHTDGPTELVLSAHRSRLDARALRLIADEVVGATAREDGSERGSTAARSAVRRQLRHQDALLPPPAGPGSAIWDVWSSAELSQRPGWASPGIPVPADATDAVARTAVLSVPLQTTPPGPRTAGSSTVSAILAVAAALVLGRYEGQERPLLAAVAPDPGRLPRALGAHDFTTLVAPALSGAEDVPGLVGSVRQQLRDPSLRCDAAVYTALTREAGGRVLVGLLPETDEGQVPCHSAPFPLTLVPRRGADGGLWLETHYHRTEIDADSARRFSEHVARTYEAVATAAPGTLPQHIDPVGPDERRSLTAQGGTADGAPRSPHREVRIDTLFTERATAAPDAVAVTYEEERLTYGELLARARRLAAGLVSRGVRPGDHVGVCLERSAELVVTLLAVLLADAVYVPMDPAYPAARLAATAHDAGLDLIITELPAIPGAEDHRLLAPAALAAAGADAPAPPDPVRGPDTAAYIIYTSGSTGRPKGVVIPHHNVTALLDATRDGFRLGPDDVWTLFHSSAFDFSVWEMWGALLTGARLVVVPYWVSRTPDDFRALLVREGVTVLSQTPSAFGQLAEADLRHRAELPLRLVVFGGEPLDTAPLPRWFDRYPETRCRLVNMFGITETTVHVTAHEVRRRDALTGSRSVGRPLPGWRVYVLDPSGRPLPYGAPGEIHVAGAGVALGYWNRPELTSERFVPDPYHGGLMYRSGDLGRLRPDGTLEHLGRLDSQVKLRGFRIELDEIRSVLLNDPDVGAAVVVLNGDRPGGAAADVRIDAYVVAAEGASLDPSAVRRRATRSLPEFMLPTGVTVLSTLPLTVNGKVDMRALPAPETAPVPSSPSAACPPGPSTREHPAADLATALAQVWEQVLGVPVGPDDNFFELGGNSLQAVRAAAVVREQGLPPVPMRELYRTPTAKALAAVLAPGPATEQ
ncbi:non-ribosomal peptide synthetase [Streptomyces lavendulae]|uniref:non-ribosomal peptide synthetase n=1 Tax=Streptomyces lavendulae TaxID=1914 RepID=UPI0036E6AC37